MSHIPATIGSMGRSGPIKLIGHIEKFLGTLIAIIVLDHLLQTEVSGSTGQV